VPRHRITKRKRFGVPRRITILSSAADGVAED
jgi:hypothetical protein